MRLVMERREPFDSQGRKKTWDRFYLESMMDDLKSPEQDEEELWMSRRGSEEEQRRGGGGEEEKRKRRKQKRGGGGRGHHVDSGSTVGFLWSIPTAKCISQRHYWVPALPRNITHLFLELNYISEINSTSLRDYVQLQVLDLGSQKVQLVIRNNAFLRQKKLTRNNFLATPDPTTFQSLLFLNMEANRFHCDCKLESFLRWLRDTNVTIVGPHEDYRCEFPAPLRNIPLLYYAAVVEPCDEDEEQAVQNIKFALFLLSAILILTVILSGILYARLRGKIFIIYKKIVSRVLVGPKQAPSVEDMQYDVFLCFSNSDYWWVEAALLNKLDNQFSEENIFHCCFEARDFLPGEDHISNIRDAIWGSRKTVCIISNEFLKDGWCLEAFALAQGRMLEELTNVLIMLVVGQVAHYQLMKHNAIRTFAQRRKYLTWPEDPQDLDWFYEQLISRIIKDTKVKKMAEDKPQPAEPNVQCQHQDDIKLENITAVAM
ncbi:hypothetical protein INR49_004377 [Caranx melampygus]|nr:hypothetical protein INR49_004377 [Caranx melampygus]